MNKTILTILIFIFSLSVPLKAGILTDDPAASQERYSMEITGAADSYKISLNLPRTSFVRLILTGEKDKTVRKLINENIRAGKYD